MNIVYSVIAYILVRSNCKLSRYFHVPAYIVFYGTLFFTPTTSCMSQKTIEQTLARCESSSTSDDNEFSLSRLDDSRSPYTPQQKLAAVMAYVTRGNSVQAAKYCEVPAHLIRRWKTTAEWWPEAFEYCRFQKQDELDAILTRVVHNANDQLEDRLLNGDPVWDAKSGTFIRKPIPGKELAVISAISQDKREIIRGGHLLKSTDKSTQEMLKLVVNEFVELSKQLRNTKELKVINEIENEVE